MSAPAVRVHAPTPPPLRRIRFVLVSPSHPGNIGSCARAMRVMGLGDLRVVAPRVADALRHPEALAFASGATDVLQAARVHPTLADALGDVTLAIAVSAEVREFGPPPATPETVCAQALEHLASRFEALVAFVFGAERTGLSIAEVLQCQRLCSIPCDDGYSSLNLAQAAQVIAYVLRQAALSPSAGDDAPPPSPTVAPFDAASVPGATGAAASVADLEGFHVHLEQALIAVGYLDPAAPRKLMPRMRRLFARAQLEREEIHLLRGVLRAMQQVSACAPVAARGDAARRTGHADAERLPADGSTSAPGLSDESGSGLDAKRD